jgi:hypothetical protein
MSTPLGKSLSLVKVADGIFMGYGGGRYYIIPILDPEKYIELTLDELLSFQARIALAIPKDILHVRSSLTDYLVFLRIKPEGVARMYVFVTIIPSSLYLRVENLKNAIAEVLRMGGCA